MGDLFAPVIGAISGQALGQREAGNSVATTANRAGLIAWVSGVLVALVVDLSRTSGWSSAGSIAPAALQGFVVALAVTWLFARLDVKRQATARR
jgi:hypothetical protein